MLGGDVTTTEQIRARVFDAEQQRLQARAAAAVAVFEQAQRCDALREQWTEADRLRGTAVVAALKLMTPAELAAFLGVAEREITGWAAAGRRRRERRDPRTKRPSTATVPAATSEDP